MDEQMVRERIGAIANYLGLPSPSMGLLPYRQMGCKPKAERHRIQLPLIRRVAFEFIADGSIETIPEAQDEIRVKWLSTGKPVFSSQLAKVLDLSLSHDDDYCLCAVGRKRQGCDLETVREMEYSQWLGLLGNNRRNILLNLVCHGDTLSQAGTRIWSAVEAIRKAGNSWDIALQIEQVWGNVVVFRAYEGYSEMLVSTAPLQLSVRRERMLAIVFRHEAFGESGRKNVDSLQGCSNAA